MSFMVLSCKKTTELIEKQNIQGLGIIERFQLKTHQSMCNVCTSYVKQSAIIDKAIQKLIEEEIAKLDPKLDEETRNRIIEKISESQGQ